MAGQAKEGGAIVKIISTPITGAKATELQLKLLNHHPGSEVWVKVDNNQPYRCVTTEHWGLDATQALNPKDANGKPRVYPEDGNKIWEAVGKHYPNGGEHFQRLANQGHQIFVIPNKVKGGIRAVDVQQCQHIFAEADSSPIPEQWERLQWFSDVTGLVPCLVVYSGGKSLHFYFALSRAIAPEDWQRVQRKIILIFRSDPQIQNLNREMRLAGVSRKDKQVSVEFTSDHRYDPIEFEQRLDSLGYFPHGLTYERWLKGRKLLKDKAPDAELLKLLATPETELFPKAAPQPQPSREFNYTGDTIPLEVCLTRDDQGLIAHGVSAGTVGRNPMAYKLACNAIGTAAALNSLGIRHSDNGYQLLEDFCRRCNPPLPDRDVQRLWKQALKSNPKASLTNEQLLKRVSYWQWTQLPPAERGGSYTTSSQELERTIDRNQWELKFGFGRWLGQTIKGVLKQAKGFGKKTVTSRNTSVPSVIRYPQDQLPRSEDYEGRDLPRIIFKKGKRLEVLAHLKALGWKFVCDRSFTGSGKSHDAGLLYPDPDRAGKIWYFDLNHTNPSTQTIEEMANMPPRHNGMVAIKGKFTPKGNPHLKWAKEDEVPMIPSLCHNADLFVKLKSKGWDVDSEQDYVSIGTGESVTRNPICKQCRFSYKCHQEEGEGYGYLAARREVMESRHIRASLDSAPNPKGAKKYDYSPDIAFVEEASRYIRGTQSLTAWGSELAQLWQYVERKAPEAFAALQPIRFALQDAINGEFDYIEKGKNRGADHETLVNELPRPDAIANLPNLIQQVRAAMPTIQDVVEEPDSVIGLGGAYRKIGQFARDMMKSQAAHQTQQNIEALPPNVLIDALEVWAGVKKGSLRVAHKQLQVTVRESRHADILAACGFVVLLDATPNIQYLEQILGDAFGGSRSDHRILEIEEERAPLSNLTVINVNMKGMGSNQISDTCKARQLALLDWITQQHQQVKVLANKGDSHLPLDGWWFNDNRGSNAFKGVEALAAFNMPRPNLGVIQDEYRALFGSLEGFGDYYQGLVDAEIVQIGGRQRVHQYPEKQFTLYLISTNQDLCYLTDLGCRVQDKEAFELTPLAGTPDQITRWKILQAVGQLQDQGQKITQEALASLIDKSQGLISKIAKEFGDWKAFKKLLLVLLGLYRGSNNFAELNENEKSLIEEYLSPVVNLSVAAIETAQTPEELEDCVEALNATVVQCIAVLGFPKFLEGVRGMSVSSQSNLLSVILRGFTELELVGGS